MSCCDVAHRGFRWMRSWISRRRLGAACILNWKRREGLSARSLRFVVVAVFRERGIFVPDDNLLVVPQH